MPRNIVDPFYILWGKSLQNIISKFNHSRMFALFPFYGKSSLKNLYLIHPTLKNMRYFHKVINLHVKDYDKKIS